MKEALIYTFWYLATYKKYIIKYSSQLHWIWTTWDKVRADIIFQNLRRKQVPLKTFSSVTQSCPTPCDPMNHSSPGLPEHHQLPEFNQTHVYRVGDASSHLILCRPLLLLPPIPPSIRVFSSESTLHMRWPKEFQPQHQVLPQYPIFTFLISIIV